MIPTDRELDTEGRLSLSEADIQAIVDRHHCNMSKLHAIMTLLMLAGFGKNPDTANHLYAIADMIMLTDSLNQDEAAENDGLAWAAEGEAARHPRERW